MGFNAIRVPCSWNQYLEADGITIKPDWMKRVKEVVDYCMNADMYTIINIHWDGGWMEGSCDASMIPPIPLQEWKQKYINYGHR